LAVKIQIRRGTQQEWESANPVLMQGELGFETDTYQWKIGNGSDNWLNLAYAVGYPDHEWDGASIRFKNPDGSWGEWVNLKSPDGVPAGGTEGQALLKNSDSDFDMSWQDIQLEKEFEELALRWDQGSDSYMRIGDAMYLLRAEFNEYYPWKGMRRCMLSDDGSVNYYIDPEDPDKIGEVVNTDYTEGNNADYTGLHGQVMVEIPKFYYKADKSGDVYRWFIAAVKENVLSEKPEGYDIHPAFVRDGIEKDYIYFSAFEGYYNDGKLESRSGVQPSTDENVPGGDITDFRGWAQARGSGWEIQDFLSTCALQILYLVEYADFNAQTEIGRGIVDKDSGTGNESENTGDTIDLGNESGMADGSDGYTSITYRGIENFWGNIWKWVDGINLNDHEAYIADHGFESDKFDEHYNSIGSVLSSSDTYVKDIIFNGADYTFLASEGGGSSSSYLTCNWWVNSGLRVARFGGRWSDASQAGAFYWALFDASSDSLRAGGSRLLFLG